MGVNDEFVSVFSVRSLAYAALYQVFTSTTDPEARDCANLPFAVGAHLCLLGYDSIVDATAGTGRRLGRPGQPGL